MPGLLYSISSSPVLSAQASPPLYREVFDYLLRRWDLVAELFIAHLWLVLLSVGIAIVIGILIGIAITYHAAGAAVVLAVCQILMTIPSLAMFGLLLPLFGIGFSTGVIALVFYSLLPIVRNTYAGIKEISPSVLESAKGMGMTEWRILFKIKFPLALPVIMAGVRTAAVMIVGIAAIGAVINAGGLGQLIFQGIQRSHKPMIITAAIFISLIALFFDFFLSWCERRLKVN